MRQQAAEQLQTSLRFGFPKGSLQNSTHELFKKAGVPCRPTSICVVAQLCLFACRCLCVQVDGKYKASA